MHLDASKKQSSASMVLKWNPKHFEIIIQENINNKRI